MTIAGADIFSITPDATNDEILVGYVASDGTACLTELTSGGSVDTSFGDDGVADLGTSAGGQAVCVRPDGEVLVAGATAGGDVTLSLLTADGQPDLSFGTGGTTTVDVTGYVYDVVAEADGTAVVAAGSYDGSTTELFRFGVPTGRGTRWLRHDRASRRSGSRSGCCRPATTPTAGQDGLVEACWPTARSWMGSRRGHVRHLQGQLVEVARLTAFSGSCHPTFVT